MKESGIEPTSKPSSEQKGEPAGFEPTLSKQYGPDWRAPLTTRPLLHCEESMYKIIVSIGANKRFSKCLISWKMVSFWKIKVHQRLWYTMRKLNSELTLSLTRSCKSYQYNIWSFHGTYPWTFLSRSLYDSLLSVNNSVI